MNRLLIFRFGIFLGRKGFISKKKKRSQRENIGEGGLDIFVIWEATVKSQTETENFVGVSNLCFLSLSGGGVGSNQNDSHLSETQTAHLPSKTKLRFTIHSSRKEMHDFSKQSICVVPVSFHIHNISSTPLSFHLETLKPTEQLKQDTLMTDQKKPQYFWAGSTHHYVTELGANDTVVLDSLACFSKPGIYNLNRFKLSYKDPTTKKYQQIFPNIQQILIIFDLNEQQNL